jgi:hypothetical protein
MVWCGKMTTERELQLTRLRQMKAEIAADLAARPRTPSLAVKLRRELRSVRAEIEVKGRTPELVAREHELCADLSSLRMKATR